MDTLAHAEAIVVDLRWAEGDDPLGALPLVEALVGQANLSPIASIVSRNDPVAKELREAASAGHGPFPARDPAPWRGLVGPAADEPPVRAFPLEHAPLQFAPIVVLFGGDCDAACEVTARMLQAYAGAQVRGYVDGHTSLRATDMGRVDLPSSGLTVAIPTTRYVLNPNVQATGRELGNWRTEYPAHVRRAVTLEGALWALRQTLAWRREERRWLKADPPPCAEIPAVASLEALPEPSRTKVSGHWHKWDRSITVTIHLPPDRARAYVGACPGIAIFGPATATSVSPSCMFVEVVSPAALSRLAQSPAVASIRLEGLSQNRPTYPARSAARAGAGSTRRQP